MRAGRLEEAGSISQCIDSLIIKANSTHLIHADCRVGVKALWDRIKKQKKKNSRGEATANLPAADLNTSSAEFSTDLNYVSQLCSPR